MNKLLTIGLGAAAVVVLLFVGYPVFRFVRRLFGAEPTPTATPEPTASAEPSPSPPPSTPRR